MNVEISYHDLTTRDESMENESGLDDTSKTNGFLYVDINDYNENNLDGIEIKQEEEQVEDFTLEKNGIESDEIYFDDNLPLNSLKNLANHSPVKAKVEEICVKNVNKKVGLSSKSIQKENISIKGQIPSDFKENPEVKRYKLRARSWSQNIDLGLIESAVERKKNTKLYTKKQTCVCSGCGVIFSSKSKYLNHETERTDFECLKCSKCFCTSGLLETHVKLCKIKKNKKNIKIGCKKYLSLTSERDSETHTISFFKCDKCKRNFVKKSELVTHILNKECSSEIFTCAVCEETFSKKIDLKKHILAHMKSQFQCQYCFEIVGNKSLTTHICTRQIKNNIHKFSKICESKNQILDRVNFNNRKCNKSSADHEFEDNQSCKVAPPTIYKCDICKKAYKAIITFRKHLNTHGENTMTCDNKKISNDSFKVLSEDRHRSTTSKKKFRYECDTCGKGFLKLVKLKIHILNIHQGINYQCGKCNVKFPNQEDFDTHMNNQSCEPEDLCKCKTCGKVFAKKDYLKKHQYMHSNILFKCKYCYCAFMKEKSYKRHMEKMNCSKSARKIRMAEFNYKKCRLCEVEYETEELLLEHFKALHIGLEPHQCFCCDSCLPTFQDLQNHIHQHNIQKYTCNLCGKPYTSQEGFRKHRLKHKGAEFKCRFCESEFLNESRFKFHEKTCKKNPESGYEPPLEKPKKKDDKPKQSRQLHWESRIIMKRLRGDPKSLAGGQKNEDMHDSSMASTFFDEPETDTSDERGWFNNYYKTDEDDIAFGLKKPDEAATQDCYSDFDVSEFLQSGPGDKKKNKASTSPSNNIVSTNTIEDGEMNTMMDNSSSSSSEVSSSDSDEEVEDTDLPIDYNPKKCRLCVISFSQEYELLHHFIKTHPGEYAHKCPQCEVQSPLYAQLKEHLKTHGIGMGIFNCDNCSKQFKSEKKMTTHNIRCKGINKIGGADKTSQPGEDGCKRCGKVFHTKFGYRRHKQLCKKKKFKNKNSEKFATDAVKAPKEDTITDNVDESNYFQLPDAEDEEEEDKEQSLKVNNCKPTPAKNPIVNKEKLNSIKPATDVPTKTSMLEIEEKKKEETKGGYTGEPPIDSFPCRLCDKKFQYERGIVMHFKSTHPGNKPLICHVCNMHLADKLKEHLKTHGIGEEFVCELCGKRFNQKFLSKIHEMWHQGIEYKCNNCKQKFLNKEKMDKHVRENRCSNRQSLMRLPCDICGKSYRSKFGLSKHYITHTPKELRPVKNRMNCEYCGKWFEYNNGLQRHRRIHTGERPFCCRFCPKAFAQEGNCKAHERIHTGESKPRRKKITAASASPAVAANIPISVSSSPQLPQTVSAHIPASSTVETMSYPGHINLYIYNGIDPNGIVH